MPEARQPIASGRLRHGAPWLWGNRALALIITTAAIALSWEAGQRTLGRFALADQRNWVSVGDQFRVPGIPPGKTATLYFVLANSCHYCSLEAGFYRALNAAATARRARTVALLPGKLKTAKAYLAQLGLMPTQVATADLRELRVPALPMLLLIGPNDRVRAEWTGALDFAQQEGVFLNLGLVSSKYDVGALADSSVPPRAVEHLLHSGAEVVDVRAHAKYILGHIQGAINIPGAELDVRAPHELAGGRLVLIYCSYCASCSSVRASEGISTSCDLSQSMLGEAGYSNVRVIGGDLSDLKKYGVDVVGSTEEVP